MNLCKILVILYCCGQVTDTLEFCLNENSTCNMNVTEVSPDEAIFIKVLNINDDRSCYWFRNEQSHMACCTSSSNTCTILPSIFQGSIITISCVVNLRDQPLHYCVKLYVTVNKSE